MHMQMISSRYHYSGFLSTSKNILKGPDTIISHVQPIHMHRGPVVKRVNHHFRRKITSADLYKIVFNRL